MDLALKVLAAFYASASALLLLSIGKVTVSYVIPSFQELVVNSRDAALMGLMMGYGVLFAMVYALCAWLLWRRRRWNRALLLAIASCFGFPVGPLLGFAAIILLTRPWVRVQFTE